MTNLTSEKEPSHIISLSITADEYHVLLPIAVRLDLTIAETILKLADINSGRVVDDIMRDIAENERTH